MEKRIIYLTLSSLLCFITLVCSAQKKEGKMDVKSQVLNTVLNLSAEDFFSMDEQKRIDIGFNKLSEYQFDGMIINTPKELDIRKKSELPVILAVSYDALREWEVDFNRGLIIVATNIITGEIFIAPGIQTKKRINYKVLNDRGPKPDGDALSARTHGCDVFYLRELLNIPWKPATYAITFICWDWVSNTVTINLSGDADNAVFENVSKIVFPPVNQRKGQGAGEIKFPTYFKIDKTPELKNSNMAFELAGEISGKSQEFPVFGAFKLPVNKNQIITENDNKEELPFVACFQCMFILVKKNQDQSLPWHSRWNLPVYSLKNVVPGDIVDGYFSIDIIGNNNTLPEPDNYCAYIIIGNQIAGPHKVVIR